MKYWRQPLDKNRIRIPRGVVHLIEERCKGCGFCVEVCPYDAISLEEYNDFGHIREVASVNAVLCKGCGACAASCLSGAIQQKKFDDVQVLSMVDALTDEWGTRKKDEAKEGV